MSIRIGIKNKPFSHDPGAKCVLPNSPYRATFYPTKIVCAAIEIPLDHTGPVRGFTVQQDLEKGFVRLYGEAQEGRVAYRLYHSDKELILYDEKKKKTVKTAVIQSSFPKRQIPRLSCGCHKKQNVYQILHRMNPTEYLPLLYHIGIGYPEEEVPHSGIGKLLDDIEQAIFTKNKLEIIPAFERFLISGIESIFSPVLHDVYHTGIIQGHLNISPHILLAKIARYIQHMFFSMEGDRIHLLPALPPALHHGRMIGLPFSLGTLDIEWTKKRIKRVQIHAQKTGRCQFIFSRDIRSFRMTKFRREKEGEYFPEDSLSLEEGRIYILDRFQK